MPNLAFFMCACSHKWLKPCNFLQSVFFSYREAARFILLYRTIALLQACVLYYLCTFTCMAFYSFFKQNYWYEFEFLMSFSWCHQNMCMMSSTWCHQFLTTSFSYKSLTDKQTFFPPTHHAVFVSEKL